MPIHPIVGHQEARRRLAAALRAGRLPQVLLITGPAGVGKQRLALWLAQLALCESPADEPCGRCRTCRLVVELAHPDLHWFVPIPRPKAGDADKMVDEAAEALSEVMTDRRATPLYPPPDGMAGHGIASVRLLQRRASLTSVEGGRKVFVLGDAERLVTQEASQEAANALLKLLEEPPADSLLILTAADPRRLLPTIRSRVVPLRLGRIGAEELKAFLRERLEPAPSARELEEMAAAAQGCIGVAIATGEQESKAYQTAVALLEAAAEGRTARLERALKQGAWAARGDFSAMLDALAELLGEAARNAVGEPVRRQLPEVLRRQRSPAPLLEALDRVSDAREAAGGNVNPQLLLAVLGEELAEAL